MPSSCCNYKPGSNARRRRAKCLNQNQWWGSFGSWQGQVITNSWASHSHCKTCLAKGCCNMCSSYRVLISDSNLASWQEMLIHIKRNSLAHPYQPTHPHIVAAAQRTLCFQWSPVDHRTDLVNHAHLLSIKACSTWDVFWPFILLIYKIHKWRGLCGCSYETIPLLILHRTEG